MPFNVTCVGQYFVLLFCVSVCCLFVYIIIKWKCLQNVSSTPKVWGWERWICGVNTSYSSQRWEGWTSGVIICIRRAFSHQCTAHSLRCKHSLSIYFAHMTSHPPSGKRRLRVPGQGLLSSHESSDRSQHPTGKQPIRILHIVVWSQGKWDEIMCRHKPISSYYVTFCTFRQNPLRHLSQHVCRETANQNPTHHYVITCNSKVTLNMCSQANQQPLRCFLQRPPKVIHQHCRIHIYTHISRVRLDQ